VEKPGFRQGGTRHWEETLIIGGVWTSVCVAFPAIQAKAEGYAVYAVIDASGDMSQMASQAALDRMTQAGVIPVTTNVIVTEVHVPGRGRMPRSTPSCTVNSRPITAP
jgi:isochorismate hydrolase